MLFAGLGLLVAGGLGAFAQESDLARPGTINYIEGSAAIDGRPLPEQSTKDVAVASGQVLSTAQGKAEMLLTPGIFFRLNDNSAVKMVSPSLTHTVVELQAGRAAVEVDQIFDQNEVQVVMNGKTTQLLKRGFYEFNADAGQVRVFDGKAAVDAGTGSGKWTVVKGDHELAFATEGKPAKFDTDKQKDELYKWSSLRSQYMAEADGQTYGDYETPGWYWNPYFGGYGFFGPDPFWSPFGWGFYGRGFYGGGFYGRPYYGHRYIGRGYVGRGYAGRGYAGHGFTAGRPGGFGGGFHSGGGFHGGGGHR
ncbi:MAG TPA: hypothetical protein VL346_05735 [Acidobacteriaceae bacterium]|nr:hypothetical protein [Acidobacteriaceae bacterium]